MELVERSALLAQLGVFLAAARSGSGCVVLLGGDAGVGKTSLVRAFVTQDAASDRVLWGSCEPLVTPEPLGPFHDMAPIAPAIAAGPSRVALLRTLLAELAAPPSTVMVIDDAHWADDSTLDALRFLGRRVHTTTGLLLIAYREDEAHGGSPLRAVLGDLARVSRLDPDARRVLEVVSLAPGTSAYQGIVMTTFARACIVSR